jgi:DNA-binding transcriptional MerR regulator
MASRDPAVVPYLRTAEVADILRVTKRTLKNWLRREFIPEPQRNPANRYRLWTLEDIEAARRLLQQRNGAK